MLYVKNYALIDEARIEFDGGLNLITGETGAGKSLLIGALGALMGGRMSVDFIRAGENKCVIEGEFVISEETVYKIKDDDIEIDNGDLTIRREYNSSGKTRCFINDCPVTVKKLAEAGEYLTDLCGQHENQVLLDSDNHLDFLDRFAGLQKDREVVGKLYSDYKKAVSDLKESEEKRRNQTIRQERIEFEIAELEAAKLELEEEDALNIEEKALLNGEQMLEYCWRAEKELSLGANAALSTIALLAGEAEKYGDFSADFKTAAEDLRTAEASIEEAVRSMTRFRTKFDFSPERLERIRERLGELSRVKRKYGGSVASAIQHLQKVKGERDSFASLEQEIAVLAGKRETAHKDLTEAAAYLSERRNEAAPRLKEKMENSLIELGFNYAEFEAKLSTKEGSDCEYLGSKVQFFQWGLDLCEIMVSTNRGEARKPLKDIASGGEISRILLALKSAIAGQDKPGTLVFDEIDNGISGKTAGKVGAKLYNASRELQILVVTHLPQIASLPGRHFTAEKVEIEGRTVSRLRLLNREERVAELAKLLTTGEAEGQGEEYARELLRIQSDER